MIIRMSFSLVASAILVMGLGANPLHSQTPLAAPRSTHGTVNIILANSNGAVIATDSRLSWHKTVRGDGQKLFRLDDHTLCSIAGWYSSAGPTMDSIHYPAYSAIPNVIRFMTEQDRLPPALTGEAKLTRLSNFIAFTLELNQRISAASGEISEPNESEITLVTFESGHLRILTATLVATRYNGSSVYVERGRQVVEVARPLVSLVRGIGDVAIPILADPLMKTPKSWILDYYREIMAKDHGSSFGIRDMTQIARKLEGLTASRFPIEVGGPVQIATIANGKAEVTEPFPYHFAFDKLTPAVLNAVTRSSLTQSYIGVSNANPDTAVLVDESTLKFIKRQPLDNILFFRSIFDHTVFTYDGSPIFYFDKSNKITDCKLILGKDVSPDSPAVLQIRRDFPDLPIEKISAP